MYSRVLQFSKNYDFIFIFSDTNTNTISKKPQPDGLAMEPLKSLAGNVTKLPNVLPSKLDDTKKWIFLNSLSK